MQRYLTTFLVTIIRVVLRLETQIQLQLASWAASLSMATSKHASLRVFFSSSSNNLPLTGRDSNTQQLADWSAPLRYIKASTSTFVPDSVCLSVWRHRVEEEEPSRNSMEWKERAQLILEKIRRYRNDDEGWKISKKSVNRSFTCLSNYYYYYYY